MAKELALLLKIGCEKEEMKVKMKETETPELLELAGSLDSGDEEKADKLPGLLKIVCKELMKRTRLDQVESAMVKKLV